MAPIQIRDVRLEVEETGGGEPLVLVRSTTNQREWVDRVRGWDARRRM